MRKIAMKVLFAVAAVSTAGTPLAAQEIYIQRESAAPFIFQGDGATFQFVRSEFSLADFKAVKGNPFSAEAVTEVIQTLGDGNRIVRQSTTTLHRDSEGRIRREQVLDTIGPWTTDGEPQRIITIHDPVDSQTLILEPGRKIARRTPAGSFHFRMESSEDGERTESETVVVTRSRGDGHHADHELAERSIRFRGAPSAAAFRFHRLPAEGEGNTVTEELGARTIEGVLSEGTRTVLTIPAGRIGNELPIEVVTERWYSPELETLVWSRHYDPRVGETVFRLVNIQRMEPDPELFQMPADFAIEDAGGKGTIRLRKDRN